MKYRGYTITTHGYKHFEGYYARVKERGIDTEDTHSRYEAIKDVKELIDNFPEYRVDPDNFLEERYEN